MSGYEEDDDRMFCIDNNPMDMTKSEIMDKMVDRTGNII